MQKDLDSLKRCKYRYECDELVGGFFFLIKKKEKYKSFSLLYNLYY
jgi:hypothetical protein